MIFNLVFILLSLVIHQTYPFLASINNRKYCRWSNNHSVLELYRLNSELPKDLLERMPECSKEWNFHLLESSDLIEASELALECFYTPRVTLNLEGMVGVEKFLWGNLINFYR